MWTSRVPFTYEIGYQAGPDGIAVPEVRLYAMVEIVPA